MAKKYREAALEQRLNQLNAVLSEQSETIGELRELCADMYRWIENDYPKHVMASFIERMRALGIEVDE